jgi:UDP-N-acetylmuramate--alanine ligase
MNALMAIAMAKLWNRCYCKTLLIKGIKERFSYQIKTDVKVYIDDYAHHQQKLMRCIKQFEVVSKSKVLAIFQPHLFSRTRDFADDFAKSLSAFDEIILLDIYPARELPMEGINSQWLMDKMINTNKN